MVPTSYDGTHEGTIFEEWGKVSLDAGDAFGKSLRIIDDAAGFMRGVGFEEVTERPLPMPIGGWPKDKRLKELGKFNRLHWEEGIEGWSMYLLTAYLKVSGRSCDKTERLTVPSGPQRKYNCTLRV